MTGGRPGRGGRPQQPGRRPELPHGLSDAAHGRSGEPHGLSGEPHGLSGELRGLSEEAESLTERELRALLQRSVSGIEPDPAALPRLRRAVPRRRAAHRHAWTGAAVVLAVLTVLPAIHGVEVFDLSSGPTASRTDAGASGGEGATPGVGTATASARPTGLVDPAAGSPTGAATASGSPGASASPSAGPSAPVPPPCDHGVLMVTDSHVDPADPSGKQYGWFAARNTAGQACRLADPGALAISAATGLDPAAVQVVAHVAGDAAVALPVPVVPAQVLVLPAGAVYRVRFGLVPVRPCPAATAAPSSDPAPSAPVAGPAATAQPAAAGGPAAPNDTGGAATATAAPSPSPTASAAGTDPSITLAYTPPQVGSPSTLVLKAGCGATVYRAAPEAVPSPSPAPSAS